MTKILTNKKTTMITVLGVCIAVFMLLSTNVKAADTSAYDCIFNAEYYAAANSDVVAIYGTDANVLFNHFINYGMAEGRRASAEFDVHFYRAAYSDLNAAFGDNLTLYYLHYMNSGKAEGRIGAGDTTATTQSAPVAQQTTNGYNNISDVTLRFVNDLNNFRVSNGLNPVTLLDVNYEQWLDDYSDSLFAGYDENGYAIIWDISESEYIYKRIRKELGISCQGVHICEGYSDGTSYEACSKGFFDTQGEIRTALDSGNYILCYVFQSDVRIATSFAIVK